MSCEVLGLCFGSWDRGGGDDLVACENGLKHAIGINAESIQSSSFKIRRRDGFHFCGIGWSSCNLVVIDGNILCCHEKITLLAVALVV